MQYVPVFMCVAPSPAYTPWTGDREENYNCNFCAQKKDNDCHQSKNLNKT